MRNGWAAVAAGLMLSACDGSQPQPTLVVEIIGTRAAFEHFQVRVSPLVDDNRMRFAGRFFVKMFSMTAPLDIATQTPLRLISTADGHEMSSIAWMPFVCRNDPSFSEKVSAGWFGQETLQVALLDSGVLSLDPEFDRPLHRACEWTSPDGTSGEGAGTQNSTKTLCTEEDRANTTVQITDVTDPGHPLPMTPTLCQAIHFKPVNPDPIYSGSIANQFVVEKADGTLVGVGLVHCWTASEVFPVEVFPTVMEAVPCGGATHFSVSGGQEVAVPVSGGTWTLQNGPDLPGGGHQISEIDLTFGAPDGTGPRFTAKGHVDLPILKTLTTHLR